MFIRKGDRDAPSLQISDLLEISNREHEIRALCRRYLSETTRRQNSMSYATYNPLFFRRKISAMIMRSQVRDLLCLYRAMRRERLFLFKNYIESLPVVNAGVNHRA